MGTMAAVAATTVGSRRMFAESGSRMKFGYTSMTWGSAERQAIDDISALGYAGIQMRNNAVSEFKPEELLALLRQHNLKFVALSSGEINIDPAVEEQQLEMHVSNAKFVKAVDGLYLQVLDQLKPYPRKVAPDECVRLGKLLTELGKRMSDTGVKLGYHNHMNTISERPENLRRVMDASDPRYVGLLLDTAHYVAGGGDPAEAIVHYRDRLLFMHLKDVVDIPLDTPGAKYPFKFVELGRGRVNLPAVMDALRKIRFDGWAIVELDRVPDKSRTPKECAAISKEYLQNQLHVKV
jgi:inosose dehydratase